MNKKQQKERWEEFERIIRERDFEAVFAQSEASDFGYLLTQILLYGKIPFAEMPQSHKILALCMELEANTQADSILNFFMENFSPYGKDAIEALHAIGGHGYAKTFSALCDYLPSAVLLGGEAGEEALDEVWENLDWEKIKLWDGYFANYEDGYFPEYYKKFALEHRKDFFSVITP